MSDSLNEFSSASDDGAGLELDGAAEMLRQTKPWARLISIMMFVGASLMVLACGVMILGGGILGMLMGAGSAEQLWGGVKFVIFCTLGIVFALLSICPAWHLWQFASRSEAFDLQRSSTALSSALQAQKSFWKFCGIWLVISLGLALLSCVV